MIIGYYMTKGTIKVIELIKVKCQSCGHIQEVEVEKGKRKELIEQGVSTKGICEKCQGITFTVEG